MPERGPRTIVTVSLLALVLVGVVAVAGRAATGLSAPVMHERFSMPEACTGSPANRTTAEMVACAEQQILRSDQQIDQLNRTIFTHLIGAASRRRFIAGHQAWLRYRRAYCQSVSDVYAGGTEAEVLDAQCAAQVNAQHVTDLRGFAREFPGD